MTEEHPTPLRRCLRLAHRVCLASASRWRNLYYRALGVRITGYAWLRAVEIPTKWSAITLEGPVSLDRGVVLLVGGAERPGKLVIGAGTYVNRHTVFDAHERVHVGRNCMIGPHCYLTDANHGTAPGAPVMRQPMQTAAVILEEDVWLGAGVTVLPGVRIGAGAVVGAGSVVTKDIPAYAVAAGVPARVIRSRRSPAESTPAAAVGIEGEAAVP